MPLTMAHVLNIFSNQVTMLSKTNEQINRQTKAGFQFPQLLCLMFDVLQSVRDGMTDDMRSRFRNRIALLFSGMTATAMEPNRWASADKYQMVADIYRGKKNICILFREGETHAVFNGS